MSELRSGIALVRRPGSTLACGLLTHLERSPVDTERAERQHEEYVAALRAAGWDVRIVEPAPDQPDSVFLEDTVVVAGSLAVLARPGAPERRGELPGVEKALLDLGRDTDLRIAHITEPATLDGGDVLQSGTTVWVGVGGRTNDAGVTQLRRLLAEEGREVVATPMGRVLHLKSGATPLPDGSVLVWPRHVDPATFPDVVEAPEESGSRVLPIGGDRVIIAASAPRTAHLLADRGLTPVVVDIGEFEKLEGSVTCLSVLIPARTASGTSGTTGGSRDSGVGSGVDGGGSRSSS